MSISVILATRNRANLLDQTLSSFAKLDTSGLAVEFLVVDNGSQDDTGDVLKRWSDRLPLNFWHCSTPGKNICLNQAVKKSNGSLLVFTDDDVQANTSWLQEFSAATERWPDHALFGGRIEPQFPANTPKWIEHIKGQRTVLFSEYAPAGQEGAVAKPPVGPNMLVRRSLFDLATFDETIGPAGNQYAMGSETEFLNRMQREQGQAFIYVPTAQVQHMIREDQIAEEWMLGRAFRAGRGMARAIQTKRKKIASVPWPIWVRFGLAYIQSFPLQQRPLEQRFEKTWSLEKWKGCIFEYRSSAQSAGGPHNPIQHVNQKLNHPE